MRLEQGDLLFRPATWRVSGHYVSHRSYFGPVERISLIGGHQIAAFYSSEAQIIHKDAIGLADGVDINFGANNGIRSGRVDVHSANQILSIEHRQTGIRDRCHDFHPMERFLWGVHSLDFDPELLLGALSKRMAAFRPPGEDFHRLQLTDQRDGRQLGLRLVSSSEQGQRAGLVVGKVTCCHAACGTGAKLAEFVGLDEGQKGP